MAKIVRSKERIKKHGEVFTPPELVNEMLDKISKDQWMDKGKTWLDPTCGSGNFLVEIKRRLLENDHDEKHILANMIFGADILRDNCIECIERLYGEGEVRDIPVSSLDFPKAYFENGIISVFTHNGKLVPNIVQADGLEYGYNFGRKD